MKSLVRGWLSLEKLEPNWFGIFQLQSSARCAWNGSRKSHLSIFTPESIQVRLEFRCVRLSRLMATSNCLSLISLQGVKPYSCDICNKTFSVKSYVTAHRWSHVSEKPLSCERCAMTFTSKSQFAIHIRTHSAGKSFLDPVWLRLTSFSYRSELRVQLVREDLHPRQLLDSSP